MGLFSGKSQRRAYMDVEGMLRDAQRDNNTVIDESRLSSLSDLGKGYSGARKSYQGAIDLYEPYATTGKSAFDLMADAYGVNGSDAATAVRGAFKESPGYQYQVDQATDAVARKASALGALGSGNTMQAITDRASNLADQEWGDWLSGLNGLAGYGYNATSAQAGLTKGIGDLTAQEGRDKSDIYSTYAGMSVGNRSNTVNNLAHYRMGIADAGSKAAANAWGVGMNLAKLGAGLLGGGLGGGTGMAGAGGTGQFEWPQAWG